MKSVPSLFVSLIFVAAFCGCASRAGADPIRVTDGLVEAGFDELGKPFQAETLLLIGAGLDIESSFEDNPGFVQPGNCANLRTRSISQFFRRAAERGGHPGGSKIGRSWKSHRSR